MPRASATAWRPPSSGNYRRRVCNNLPRGRGRVAPNNNFQPNTERPQSIRWLARATPLTQPQWSFRCHGVAGDTTVPARKISRRPHRGRQSADLLAQSARSPVALRIPTRAMRHARVPRRKVATPGANTRCAHRPTASRRKVSQRARLVDRAESAEFVRRPCYCGETLIPGRPGEPVRSSGIARKLTGNPWPPPLAGPIARELLHARKEERDAGRSAHTRRALTALLRAGSKPARRYLSLAAPVPSSLSSGIFRETP